MHLSQMQQYYAFYMRSTWEKIVEFQCFEAVTRIGDYRQIPRECDRVAGNIYDIRGFVADYFSYSFWMDAFARRVYDY